MRPHRLRLAAFGPFAGCVEVDLDRLATGGLFLLHGETGAGKTTLLDGLGFALYGRVPGARQTAGQLRSDHADPGTRTEVELEVTLGDRRWRITRSPVQARPKSRGMGMTTEPARVLLEVLEAGEWQTVSTRLDEAAGELDPLLGMSADQFFQVVLLPQGEFARFLRGRSAERGELLERLFATQRFAAVEDWLASRRSCAAGAVVAAEQATELLEARLAQAAGRPAGPGLPDPPSPTEVLTVIDRERAVAQAEVADAATVRDAARRSAAAVQALADRQRRRGVALAAREQLDDELAAHEALGAELAAAGRAAELAPVLAEAAAREAARCAATTAEAAVRTDLLAAGLAPELSLTALRGAAAAARERSGRLDGLRGLAGDLDRELAVGASAAREAGAAGLIAEGLRDRLAGLPARRAAAVSEVAAARAAGSRLPTAQVALAGLTAAHTEAGALETIQRRLADLHHEQLLARETAVLLREKESELREARLTTMVAELASTLVPGLPCEVCGSTEHPDPYEGDGEGVTRDDEDRARIEAEQAALVVTELQARLAAAGATAEDARTRLAAAGHRGSTVAILDPARKQAAAEVDTLAVLAGALEGALAVVEGVDTEQAHLEAELVRAETQTAAAVRRSAEATGRVARLATQLSAGLEGLPDLPAALRAAERTAQVCDAAAAAVERAERAAAEASAARAAAVAGALTSGFPTADRAAAAVRSSDWRGEATTRRRAYDDRSAAATASLADPELAVVLVPAADVSTAVALATAADLSLERAVGVLAAAQARAIEVSALVPRVEHARDALGPLLEEAARVKRLADLCAGSGANALRMTLTSFVLAARLEEVAVAATGRLLQMTQGRYALVHTDGPARGGVRSGLGLLVRDSWTGRDRDTSTLSGGETFQASLALALGLADVVQAESGGARIEALFVDEGFGTLDEGTLDEVMDVLDGLREGGRIVGLVSHVAELRTRIPAQVHVRKGRGGSTVELVGC